MTSSELVKAGIAIAWQRMYADWVTRNDH